MGVKWMKRASISPVMPEVRDRVRAFRDEYGYKNYNSAVSALLDAAERQNNE